MNYAIIAAGGMGMRFGGDIPKQFTLINGIPILRMTVDKFEAAEDIYKVIVACPEEYVAAALAPANVVSVTVTGERSCRVRVEPDQLSLAIGKEGQNARLAAKLTGYKIDIKADDFDLEA